jgi:hypothetical protein
MYHKALFKRVIRENKARVNNPSATTRSDIERNQTSFFQQFATLGYSFVFIGRVRGRKGCIAGVPELKR